MGGRHFYITVAVRASVGMTRMLLAMVALLAALPASASTLESATGGLVSYQFDGDTHHDAPDLCEGAGAAWRLPYDGRTDGLLVPPDDLSDAFVLEVPASGVGQRLRLAVEVPEDAADLRLDAYAPGCMGSVFDVMNQPSRGPNPPEPAAGEEQHSADVARPTRCDDFRLFVLDHMQGYEEPESIHVAWTDGTEGPVPLHGRYGSLAVYVTEQNVGITLKGAWANVASGWDGRFLYAVGPCDAVHGGAVYGDEPTVEPGALEFTPVQAGLYIVVVRLGDNAPEVPRPAAEAAGPALAAAEDPEAAAEALLADPTAAFGLVPGAAVPMSCHWCTGALEPVVKMVSYFLSSSKQAAA